MKVKVFNYDIKTNEDTIYYEVNVKRCHIYLVNGHIEIDISRVFDDENFIVPKNAIIRVEGDKNE